MDWVGASYKQNISFEFLEKHLYKYSLYLICLNGSVNKDKIKILQEKYTQKYDIDKLAYEFSHKKIQYRRTKT